jgi:phosphate starvation-inducible protein PhoH
LKTSRKERRQASRLTVKEFVAPSVTLSPIKPKTENQDLAFRGWGDGQHLFLHGLPGTGKSFVALYLALKSVMLGKQKKVVIVRSAVPTRDIGFMPGSVSEKMKNYEAPYVGLCSQLFGRGDAYDILKQKKLIEFMPTSFIRGLTIDDAVIIIEEAQNMGYQEVRSVITRIGDNSRFIVNGDLEQDDLSSERFREETGLKKLMGILNKIKSVDFIEFGVDDIVRSDFIKEFIIAEYGL